MGDLIRKGLKLGETGSSSDSGRCSPKIWSKIRLGANQEKKGLRIRGLWMVISIGERWRSLANNCAAVLCRERGQLYTLQLAWPSTPPRPLEQWCQGFYCPTPGLGPSAVPSSCLRDLCTLPRRRRRGKGRGRRGAQWGSKRLEWPGARPAAHVLFVHSPGRVWPVFQLPWMPAGSMQLLSLARRDWHKGPLFPGLGSCITRQGCAYPGSKGSPKIRAREVPGGLCWHPGTPAVQPCRPRGVWE